MVDFSNVPEQEAFIRVAQECDLHGMILREGFIPMKLAKQTIDQYKKESVIKFPMYKEPNHPFGKACLFPKDIFTWERFESLDDGHYVNTKGDTLFLYLSVTNRLEERNLLHYRCTNGEVSKRIYNSIRRVRRHLRKANQAIGEYEAAYLQTYGGALELVRTQFDKFREAVFRQTERMGFECVHHLDGTRVDSYICISNMTCAVFKMSTEIPHSTDTKHTIFATADLVFDDESEKDQFDFNDPVIVSFYEAIEAFNRIVHRIREDKMFEDLGGELINT